jgi:hypothetical protein
VILTAEAAGIADGKEGQRNGDKGMMRRQEGMRVKPRKLTERHSEFWVSTLTSVPSSHSFVPIPLSLFDPLLAVANAG